MNAFELRAHAQRIANDALQYVSVSDVREDDQLDTRRIHEIITRSTVVLDGEFVGRLTNHSTRGTK